MGIKPTRVILYARVSSAEQRNRQTIESQPPELERLVASLDGPVEIVLAPDGSRYWLDDGRSGRTLRKRQLAAMLDGVDAGTTQADLIVCVRMDRLYRRDPKSVKSVDDCHRIERTLLQHKVRVLTTEGYADPSDALVYGVRTAMASQENITKSNRVNEARANRLQSGKPIWRLPYGYRRSINPMEPVAIDEVRAGHLRRLVTWTIEGGVAHASRRANEAGIPLPSDPIPPSFGPLRQWDQAHLWRIVAKADVYLGTLRYTYRGVSGEVAVPPILDSAAYLQLRSAMASKAKPRGKRVHAFSGLLKCSCGHTMQLHTRRETNVYLQCHFCPGGSRYDGDLEAWLWTSARAWVMALADADAEQAKGNGLEAALHEAREALKVNKSEERYLLKIHLKLHSKEPASEDVYLEESKSIRLETCRLKAVIDGLRKRIAERNSKAESEANVIDRAFAVSKQMAAEDDPRKRNRILRDLLGVDRIAFVKEADQIRVTFPKRGTLEPFTVVQGEPTHFRLVIGPEGAQSLKASAK